MLIKAKNHNHMPHLEFLHALPLELDKAVLSIIEFLSFLRK